MKIAVAGGGVGGLEALLGLHAIAGDRVSLTLIAPDEQFSSRYGSRDQSRAPPAARTPRTQRHA